MSESSLIFSWKQWGIFAARMKSFACLSSKVFCCIGSLFLALSLCDSAQANELIGHWKLDESSGSIAADSTTNGNSGAHTGAGITQSTDSKASLSCSNQASLSLSGQGGYINIPDDVSINPQQSFTIALWLNPNSLTTGYRHILFRKAVLTGLGIWAQDGKILSEVDFVDADSVLWLTDTDVLTVNTWLHVAITYDSNTLRRYINGVQDKEASVPQKSLVYSSGQPLKLGAGDYNASFDGYIDDVRLYDYGLSSSDVLDLALGGCDTDLEPDAFSFTDQTDVAVSTQITSNTITVAGITSAAAISVTGGEYAINGGSYTTDAGTVENGNTVTVRHTSSGSFSTATSTTLTISEVSETFTSTTASDHPACLEPLNVGTIGTAGNCEGLLIVDRGMLNNAKNDATYAITAPNGVAYTFGDSQYNIYTGQVTNLSSLFQNTAFNEDIGYWEVANVTTFQSMFQFNGTFHQDLSSWKVTNKTTSIRGMFNHSGAADQNLSGWDVSQVTDFFAAFTSDHSKWSPANYDATLNAWAQRDYPPMLDSNGDPGMRYVPSYSYFTGEGTAARDALIDKGFVFQNDDVTTDVTPPELASTTPTDGATGVGIDTDITLTFTESVSRLGANRPNGNIVELVRSSDDQIIETFSTNSRVVSTSFTLDPSNDLDEGTTYYIRISPIAFYDNSNNPFPGIINKTSYSFQTIAPLASQTINFGQPSDDEITMGSVTLSATASSGLAVAFASNTVDVCSVIGTTATYSAIGTCTIAASQAGNATYAAAPTVMRSFQITLAAQTITFAQPSDDELTSSVVILSASASSGLPVSYSSNTPDICSVAGAQVSYIAIGACTVTASQPGDNTYAAANNVTRSFNITDADSDEDGIGDSEDDFPLADTEETSGEVTLQTTPSAANSSCTIDSLAVATAATESPGVAVNGIGKGISFALSGCDTSNLETLSIRIDLGIAPAEGSVAMKIDSDGNWSEIEGATIEDSVVTYTITDNGPLDQDSDTGTMADPVTVAVPYSAPALPVPALPALLLGLLSLLMGLLGYRRLAH